MKAVRIHEFGGPEVLRYEDVSDPKPRKDQVLIRVKSCAMNHLDLWVRKGLPGVKLPRILGSDISGEIVEVGEYITRLQSGQRVLLAPMHFCNHCAYCTSGRQNQCAEFTVIGNRVDGGNCELMAVPAGDVVSLSHNPGFYGAPRGAPVFPTAFYMLNRPAAICPRRNPLGFGGKSRGGIAALPN